MAGRRWAEGGAPAPDDGKRHLRPSERRSGVPGDAPEPKSKGRGRRKDRPGAAEVAGRSPEAVKAAQRPQPSPEALRRAKERLSPPKAPWHPLPLAELGILIGFVLMTVAFLLGNVAGAGAGFTLVILSTVEFSWREHRHGFRSHGAVLGGVVGLAVGVICWRFVGLQRQACLGAGIVVFLALWALFTKTYVAEEDRVAKTAEPGSTA